MSLRILAIDPGPTKSAFLVLRSVGHPRVVVDHGHIDNHELLARLQHRLFGEVNIVVLEQIESMGMAVGAEVFETVFWSGRFAQASSVFDRVTRRAVKLHLCGTSRAKDGNVRQALLDRFGGAAAKGTKREPGPLYGVAAHAWAALGVAVTWLDARPTQEEPF